MRPDALTPALSHREREQTQKTATWLPFCFYLGATRLFNVHLFVVHMLKLEVGNP
ncbi:hypothetical protein EKTHUN627_00790 [Enterobacter kobei]|nr:hypothetical protein EKTHUN627_00790 [Enterobacter kobei]GJA02897.1 hypothetical protein ECV0102_32450 [Enterobacter cloacae]